ncbi:MAG: hypothetical protein ACO2PO_15595, partial [Candidatus Calescibacterium sp.]
MKIIKNIIKNIAATTVLSVLSLFIVVYDVFSTPYPVTTFPSYLQNSFVVRFTGCFTKWIWENISKLIQDDGIAGSSDDLCPAGQYGLFSGSEPSFSSTEVSCGWKTLNMINAIIMSLLDKQKDISMRGIPDDPVLCCCNPAKDPKNCTGPNVSSSSLPISLRCPPQFPNLGDCLKLKPEATNYKVTNYIEGTPPHKIIRGYQAWSVTWVAAPGSSTAYWVGLLDQCIPLPLAGNICINLSLDDVCKGGTCGPVRGYNSTLGYCVYTPCWGDNNVPCATDVYMSSTTDGWIIRYDPRYAFIWTYFDRSQNSCGMGWGIEDPNMPPPTYNGKNFTGNEGFLTLDLMLGTNSNPVLIDIDAATPARDDLLVPPISWDTIPPGAIAMAPGKTDCNPETPDYEVDCYVRAYLQAIGMLKLKVGLTFYLEHRTYNWPHIQDIGIGIREINFSEAPWLSLALQWRWFGKGCSNCVRSKITEKAIQTFAFLDTIMRGLFRYSYIPIGAQKYFGPLVFDISNMTQISTSHLFPTWVRPITQDDLLIDIALGGDPVYGTRVLRSKACFAENGVGSLVTGRNELYLIASAMIDLDLFRKRTAWKDPNQWADHRLPGCGYLGSPYHPAPNMFPGPTTFGQLPHAGSKDSALVSCDSNATAIGISIFENVFTYLISDVASSGVMCLALSQKGRGLASSIPLPIWTVGQMKMTMPELYNFLESEFGSDVTDIPIIFVFKPKFTFGSVPTPSARLWNDLSVVSGTGIPITADVIFYLPNNDLEIWVDVDKEIEQWGCGPGEYSDSGDPPFICIECQIGNSPPGLGWCSSFPSGSTPPQRLEIEVGPSGNRFVNNFPDCVSFIDCDTTIGKPADRNRERRFLGQFNVSVRFTLDLNLYGCGRASGKFFSGLGDWGFPTTWYNPWNPLQPGNCTTVSHLRRIDLTSGVISRVLSFDVTNDSGRVRVYYPFSNGTFSSYIADFLAVMLSGELALDAQLGYTLSAIFDPDSKLYSSDPQFNNVLRIGGHPKGGTADRLIHTYITRDDIGNLDPDPVPAYQQRFLTIAIDFQGFIHPDWFYHIISQLLRGEKISPYQGSGGGGEGGGDCGIACTPEGPKIKIFDEISSNNKQSDPLEKIVGIWRKITNGEEHFISFRDIQEFVKKVEKSGLVVPMKKNENGGIDDFPPETVVEYVQASQHQTIIKLSCVDDYTKPDNCWFGWRWKGKRWQPWIQSNTIEIRGLPHGE